MPCPTASTNASPERHRAAFIPRGDTPELVTCVFHAFGIPAAMDPEHFDPPSLEYPEYGARSVPMPKADTSPAHSGTRFNGIPALQRLCEGEVVAQKYFVDRLLGRDGLATVAIVRHVELGRRYLLKLVPPEHCA